MTTFDDKGYFSSTLKKWRYDDNKKIYVQDKLAEDLEVLEEFFGEGGVFYICGDRSEMSKDVRNLLIGFGVLLVIFYFIFLWVLHSVPFLFCTYTYVLLLFLFYCRSVPDKPPEVIRPRP